MPDPPPSPNLSSLARRNVRIIASAHVAAQGADSAPDASESARVAWVTVGLAIERVPELLARQLVRRVRQTGGAASLTAADLQWERGLVLHVSATVLDRLLAFLSDPAGLNAGGLAVAIEHAWRSYETALSSREPTRIMGIVNVTPDSFNPAGRHADPGAAVEHALRLVEEGADLLDVGGESSRPGALAVSAEEELARVLPVVQRLARETQVPISVDTTKSEVAERCLDAGATWINDISGLTFDPRLAEVAAAAGATLVLMHIRGTPRTMQENPTYDDVVADTLRFLRERMAVAHSAGISESALVIDPGFGFGKTVEHNLEILRRLREYTSAGTPILLGTSRKSTIGHVLGGLPPEERLEGTAATVAAAILNGAAIVRVHDVQAMWRVARMTDAIMGKDSAIT
jgi:dihydropteroate synthase